MVERQDIIKHEPSNITLDAQVRGWVPYKTQGD